MPDQAKFVIFIISLAWARRFSFARLSIYFFAGLKFIKARAEAMQRASEREASGLLSIFVRPDSKLKEAMADAIAHLKWVFFEKYFYVVSTFSNENKFYSISDRKDTQNPFVKSPITYLLKSK